jgi:predicted GNAT family acetyltransferase
MTDAAEPAPVRDDREDQRFVVTADGETAELVYQLEGRRFVLVHTGVPDALSGRGIGGRLVQAALDRATAENLEVVPVCPYARSWLERHPDAARAVDVDWDA